MKLSRRKFFALAGASAAGFTMVSPLEAYYARVAKGQVAGGVGYGSLRPTLPVNASQLRNSPIGDYSNIPILQLPPGFNYTAISLTGEPMDDGGIVPGGHDGMAAFRGPNKTTILVRNHELRPSANGVVTPKLYDRVGGGTTTVVVGSNRQVVKQFASLGGTIRNCAGGPTPWGSWISCEEDVSVSPKKHGYNFEVPATAEIAAADPVPLVAMGRFNHEAVAVDPATMWVYQTEDRDDSCFYRFRSNEYGNLRSGGTLEALRITDSRAPGPNTGSGYLGLKGVPLSVDWVKIDDVDPAGDTLRKEAQTKGAATFVRGEGAWYGNSLIYFVATSGGNVREGQVWAYNPRNSTIILLVESPSASVLNNPDNITVAPFDDLFLCEDGDDDQFIVGVNTQGELYQFAKNNINESEYAGACFSPDGQTMFVSIQSPGITLAIWGPWNRKRS